MGSLCLVIEGRPVPYRTQVGQRGQVFYPATVRAWQKTVTDQAKEQLPEGWIPIDSMAETSYRFFMPRPKSHWRTGKFSEELKPDAPEHHLTPPDVTKLLRITEDGLIHAGVATDDSLFTPIIARKAWTTRPDTEGGVVVEVTW